MSIHYLDEGTIFQITLMDGSDILDVSSATSVVAYFKRPNNGTVLGPKTLTKPNGGTDGLVQYIWGTGELDTIGEWTFQVYVTFPSGIWHSDYSPDGGGIGGKFTVYANLV